MRKTLKCPSCGSKLTEDTLYGQKHAHALIGKGKDMGDDVYECITYSCLDDRCPVFEVDIWAKVEITRVVR